jgi:LmbE family N-acetylglucosaminyl deacetylase
MIDRLRKGIENCRRRLTCECFQRNLLLSLNIGAAFSPEGSGFTSIDEDNSRVKVLLVVAHPDDESECAAFVYRVTHELGGTVDQVVVTNGAGGDKYSAPAQAFYRLPLKEDAWRKQLVRIRSRELIEAGRILGIRNHYLLEQTDTGFTMEPRDGLRAWDTERIRENLSWLLQREKYDLVILLLPTIDTHGHHTSVALLTLEVIRDLHAEDRPATLGVRTLGAEAAGPEAFFGLDCYPLTRTVAPEPVWVFDRRTRMNCHRGLDYSIISNWVIAEHKSQGAFQMEFGRRIHECFWLFEVCGESGAARWREFMGSVGPWGEAFDRYPSALTNLRLQEAERHSVDQICMEK